MVAIACAAVLAAWPAGIAAAQDLQGVREGGRGQAPPSVQVAPWAILSGASPFMGSVRAGQPVADTLRLTLADAVSRGLANNLAGILGRQAVDTAGGTRLVALSGLLPTVIGHVSQTQEKLNLEAFGFPIPAGMSPIVGPFNVFDARLSVSQSIFDLSAIETARAGSHVATAAEASYADTRDTVVLVCASMYLRAVIGGGLIDAVRAQLQTAEVLHARAVDMKTAGVVAGIDVLRAEFELQAQKQRLIVVENEVAKQKLALARAIGLPLGQKFELVDSAPYAPLGKKPLDELLTEAFNRRSDLKSAAAVLRAAEATRQAILGEALPSFRFAADYGDIGNTVSSAKATFTVGVQLRVPLFQGGRVRGRLQQADAGLASERATVEDLRGRIEVRSQDGAPRPRGRRRARGSSATRNGAGRPATDAGPGPLFGRRCEQPRGRPGAGGGGRRNRQLPGVALRAQSREAVPRARARRDRGSSRPVSGRDQVMAPGFIPRQPRTRRILLAAVILVPLLVAALWWYLSGRESTDDAQIDGHITPIAARVGGTVLAVRVDDNQNVQAGIVLVEIDPRDYQVAAETGRGGSR